MSGTSKVAFGRHAGKTFEYMLENEFQYCLWAISNAKAASARSFLQYLKESPKMMAHMESRKDWRNALRCVRMMNVTQLAARIDDPIITRIVQSLVATTHKYPRIRRSANIPAALFGQFIDYYLRYRISVRTNTLFVDRRAENAAIQCNMETDEKTTDAIAIGNSYARMQSGVDVAHRDVLNCAVAHSLWFGRSHTKFIDADIDVMDGDSEKAIEAYVEDVVKEKDIHLNPAVSALEWNICGDADMVIGEKLVDVKVVNGDVCAGDIVQLLIYAALWYKKCGEYIKNISIYNPLCGTETIYGVSSAQIDAVFDQLNSYEIGSDA